MLRAKVDQKLSTANVQILIKFFITLFFSFYYLRLREKKKIRWKKKKKEKMSRKKADES